MIEYRLRDWRVQVSPSRQWEIASLPIPNSFFSGEGLEGPQIPHQTRAYGARKRPTVSPVFRVPPSTCHFQHLSPSLRVHVIIR